MLKLFFFDCKSVSSFFSQRKSLTTAASHSHSFHWQINWFFFMFYQTKHWQKHKTSSFFFFLQILHIINRSNKFTVLLMESTNWTAVKSFQVSVVSSDTGSDYFLILFLIVFMFFVLLSWRCWVKGLQLKMTFKLILSHCKNHVTWDDNTAPKTVEVLNVINTRNN